MVIQMPGFVQGSASSTSSSCCAKTRPTEIPNKISGLESELGGPSTAPGPYNPQAVCRLADGDIFIFMITYHLQLLLLGLAGWVNRYQQAVIDYLQEENRVLRAQASRQTTQEYRIKSAA